MSETNQPRKPVRGFASFPEALRREVYQLVNESHDAGARCMKAYFKSVIDEMIDLLKVGGLAHQINPTKTDAGRFILEQFLITMTQHPDAGMHPHSSFESFEREFSTWLSDQPEDDKQARSFVTRPVSE